MSPHDREIRLASAYKVIYYSQLFLFRNKSYKGCPCSKHEQHLSICLPVTQIDFQRLPMTRSEFAIEFDGGLKSCQLPQQIMSE